MEVDHSNKYDIADIHVQVGIDEHTKKITETNIENRNGNPKSTLPVLVYRHVSLLFKIMIFIIEFSSVKHHLRDTWPR